jgi:Domain of unknown function (DUF3883)
MTTEISERKPPEIYGLNFLGTLRTTLQGLLGFTTVLNELIQNAEDAGATEFHADICDDALWIGNNAVFEEKHLEAIKIINSGSKSNDLEKIGTFGVGFVSVYQYADIATLICHQEVTEFSPLEQKISFPHFSNDLARWDTTFKLPWAFTNSQLREKLKISPVHPEQLQKFLEEAQETLEETVLFLKKLENISLYRNRKLVLEVKIKRQPISPEHEKLIVWVNDTPREYNKRTMQIVKKAQEWLEKDGNQRRTDVSLIRPMRIPEGFSGRLFAYLPTQTESGLPFHINGDFHPTPDRKSIVWDGEDKAKWNRFVLDTIAENLRIILEDVKAESPSALYQFCSAIQNAQAPTKLFLEFRNKCWDACKEAFKNGEFFHTEQDKWVKHGITLLPEKHITEPVRKAIRQDKNWHFTHPDHNKYAKTLEELGTGRLILENCLRAFEKIFENQPVWLEGTVEQKNVTLKPFLKLLNHYGAELDENAIERLTPLCLGISENGTVLALEDLKRITEGEIQGLRPWIDLGTKIDDNWIKNAPPALSEAIQGFDLDEIIQEIQNTSPEQILEEYQNGWDCSALYNLLESWEVTEDAGSMSIFPSEGFASFHDSEEIVRPGDFKDPFGVRTMMEEELAQKYEKWLDEVGIPKLDSYEYLSELLPKHFESLENVKDKRKVIEFLVKHSDKLPSDNVRQWQNLDAVECTDGQWKPATDVYFGSELLDDLFGKYSKLVSNWKENPKARALFERLGVKREAGREDVINVLEKRSTEPVSDENIRVREKVVKWLSGVSDEQAFLRLSKLAWLPDFDKKRWYAPNELYPKFELEVMAKTLPLDKAFCGMDILEGLIKNLKMLRATPDLIVQHLIKLVSENRKCSPNVYAYLDCLAKAGQLSPHIERLRHPCIYVGDKYIAPNKIFTRKHSLEPWRSVLPQKFREAHKHLVKILNIREYPERDDHINVLLEISSSAEKLGGTKLEDAIEVAQICLRALADHYEKDSKSGWEARLKGHKIIPCGGQQKNLDFTDRTFIEDVSDEFVKRYKLESLKNVFAPTSINSEFLRVIGVKSLKESVQIEFKEVSNSQISKTLTDVVSKLESAILRIAMLPKNRKIDKLTELFRHFEVYKASEIVVHRIVDHPTIRISQEIPFDFAYDAKTYRLLMKEPSRNNCAFAIAEALEIPTGSEFGNLVSIFEKTPEEAIKFLDMIGIAQLPAKWKPREIPETPEDDLEQVDIQIAMPGIDSSNLPALDINLSQVGQNAVLSPNFASTPNLQKPQSPPTSNPNMFLQDSNQSTHSHESTSTVSTAQNEPNSRPLSNFQHPSLNVGTQRQSESHETKERTSQNRHANNRRVSGSQQKFKTYVYVTPGEPNDDDDKQESIAHQIDRRGMDFVMAYETEQGRIPVDVSNDYGLGYDIESTDSNGEMRRIELKTTTHFWGEQGVTLSANQFQKALRLEDRYWLYVVGDVDGDPQIYRIQNPAGNAMSFVFDEGWSVLIEDDE